MTDGHLILSAGAMGMQSAATRVEASTGTVMIAVLPLILGVQLVLQALVLDIQSAPRLPLSRRGAYGRARLRSGSNRA